MTETNEQLTLHTDSIDTIVAVLSGEKAVPGSEEQQTIANTIEAQR